MLSAFVLAHAFRVQAGPSIFDDFAGAAIASLLFVGVFAVWRLYSVYRYSEAEEFRRMIAAVSVAMTVVIMGSFCTDEGVPLRVC